MNVKQLRDEMIESFKRLQSGGLKAKDAKELTNMAGKIIMSAKVQSDYNKQVGNANKIIGFLDVESEE